MCNGMGVAGLPERRALSRTPWSFPGREGPTGKVCAILFLRWEVRRRSCAAGRPPMSRPGCRSRLGTLAGPLVVCAAVLRCASVPVAPVTAEGEGWVESRTFAVPAPGDGWELEIDRPTDRVAYETVLLAPPDQREIWTFSVEAAAGPRVADGEPLPPEQELADRYLTDEDQRAGAGRRSIERGVETVAGKRLHFLRWEDHPWLRVGLVPVPGERRTTVYLYFPPERGGRASYVFRVREEREQANIYTPRFDRTRAFPFIAGFRLR